MKRFIFWIFVLFMVGANGLYGAESLELTAAKDTFGRSNQRNQNSGGSPVLYIAHNSMLRATVAFDLSSVTNKILGAELVLHQQDTNENPISLIVSPMVYTPHNAAWKEGTGALGTKGRNAKVGEATFSRSAYPDLPWENDNEKALDGMEDSGLWQAPVGRLQNQSWHEGEDVRMKLDAAALLEKSRESKDPIVTFGIWGTQGNGYYGIAAKESGNAPKLILTLEGK